MPVCLTGDVHHSSLRTADQMALSVGEPSTALTYADIVSETGINATLFLTGRTADEDPEVVRTLADNEHIEIGGHNYGAFTIPALPMSGLLFHGYETLTGDLCPRWVQRFGVNKTIRKLEAVADSRVLSWRNHAFKNDGHTYGLLSDSGIKYVSDMRSPDRMSPYRIQNEEVSLTEVPINVPPDHDHIAHGEVNPPAGWSDPFSGDIYSGEEWLDRVVDAVEQIDRAGGVATVLAHPACMALVDDFQLFSRLCEELSTYSTVCMREVADWTRSA